MRIAVTADLHWGHNAIGNAATTLLIHHLLDPPPDLLLLGGDLGSGAHFGECLEQFRAVECPKALVPGNHDIWVSENDARGDSLQLYDEQLPALCAANGVHYLDRGPLVWPERQLAVVGTMNWYDYSWSIDRLKKEVPDYEVRLRHMAFTRGRHNDRRFVRWELDDERFTQRVVATFERHLQEALTQVERAVVMTHHPAFYGLGFPRLGPPSVPDGLLWDAFAGNKSLEEILNRNAERITHIFSGHTHRACQNPLGSAQGVNIGGDYRFKRLIELEWPTGEMQVHEFGES